jgi:hypothetical protein
VRHPPERVFEFLSNLENHWLLEQRFVALDEVHGNAGGRVRIRGPLGLSRVAETRVVEARPPTAHEPGELNGRADLGETIGRVRWRIDRRGDGSEVTLSAWVERASALDRLLLAVGGRRLLQRIFESAVARLDAVA